MSISYKMGFNLEKTLSHTGKSISHAFKDSTHNISKTVGTVYNDGKSAVSYGGKHLIKDVDNVSNALSNPMTIIVIGVLGVGAILILTR